MNHTIQLTTEQFQALQSGQPITIEPPKPAITKWEPMGGHYCIANYYLSADYWDNTPKGAIPSGLAYKNIAQAEHAAKALRAYARQIAWISEHCDGWVADWSDNNQNKYYVYFDNSNSRFRSYYLCCNQYINIIPMSKSNAEKLAQLMNDGIVEF